MTTHLTREQLETLAPPRPEMRWVADPTTGRPSCRWVANLAPDPTVHEWPVTHWTPADLETALI